MLKESFNKISFAKKKNDMYLKNGNFPQLQRPLALKQELKQFLQKIYSCPLSFICHIGDLQTYHTGKLGPYSTDAV